MLEYAGSQASKILGEGSFYISAITTVQFVGVFIGTLIFAPLSDQFGRRKVSIFVVAIGIVAVVLFGKSFFVLSLGCVQASGKVKKSYLYKNANFFNFIRTLLELLPVA